MNKKVHSILKDETKVQMYVYLAKNDTLDFSEVANENQEVLKSCIKELASTLHLKNELFNRKMQVEIKEGLQDDDIFGDESIEIQGKAKYDSISNYLIYRALEKIDESLIDEYNIINDGNKITDILNNLESTEVEYKGKKISIDEAIKIKKLIPRAGSNLRISLLEFCRIFLNDKSINGNIRNTDGYIEYLNDASLAEEVLRVHTAKEFKKYIDSGRIITNKACDEKPYGQQLETDLTIWDKKRFFIIDVKVYSKVIGRSKGDEKNKYFGYRYVSNTNRYQVNSYIGAHEKDYKNKYKFYDKKCIGGALVHFVSEDMLLDDKSKNFVGMNTIKVRAGFDWQRADLTIEPDRPIELFVIVDRGLKSIFEQYDDYIKKKFNIQEELQF